MKCFWCDNLLFDHENDQVLLVPRLLCHGRARSQKVPICDSCQLDRSRINSMYSLLIRKPKKWEKSLSSQRSRHRQILTDMRLKVEQRVPENHRQRLLKQIDAILAEPLKSDPYQFSKNGNKYEGCLCMWCLIPLSRKNGSKEHLKPRSWGGGDEDDNIGFACCQCNSDRGKITDLFAVKKKKSADEFKNYIEKLREDIEDWNYLHKLYDLDEFVFNIDELLAIQPCPTGSSLHPVTE